MTLTKIVLSMLLVSSAARGSSYERDYPASPAKYRFAWAVKDQPSLNDYAQEEERDGDVTRGSYRVALPDGRLQVVNYHVDKDSGFIAGVEHSGEIAGRNLYRGDSPTGVVNSYQETSHRSSYSPRGHKNNRVINLSKSPARLVDYADADPHQDSKSPNKPQQQLEILHIDRPAYVSYDNQPTPSWPNRWYHSRIQSERYNPRESGPHIARPQDPTEGELETSKVRVDDEPSKNVVPQQQVLSLLSSAKTDEAVAVPQLHTGVLWREEYMRRMEEKRAGKQRESVMRSSQAEGSNKEPVKEEPKLKASEPRTSRPIAAIPSTISGDSLQPKPGTQRKPFLSDYAAPL